MIVLAGLLDDALLVDEELLFAELLTELLDDAITAAELGDKELLSAVSPPQAPSASANAHAQQQTKPL